ncbi:hypothetical protein NVP1188A_12 [Vibrio phage 1.188.A._10N.286.51.A6]|uniref:Uncharacterized protein n=6 Tax=Mukerjeevirus TaxID=2733146 RepID=A0A2I7REI2_9CAUD|nr:hypothetical protein HOU76_gp78 [Vibrio phage 1.169.O._10N.261.52.B1]YP_009817471.1 hypothetical protein HOU77_gp12 [Vibrio phage 1.188.A._10N.286.51.A6]YP_009817613.1 hypothetical protein HOU79_gp13 [Vibrio phage 1.224.A._10N.261.48.B1]YP_009817698.1 hypothetical protein HOU80_gp13 [Vibrio phage 1.261.O._10N.286.51.A7]AUR93666.1 hypothetical protein NVP1188B_12 [Vibrio phage 1.188.B._10N.286.51.A6]AUR93752.1 hypothetical protein NVP1188C_12 [Vibrio phage 1.188.C._10N.286.51.A6]AUR92049.1 
MSNIDGFETRPLEEPDIHKNPLVQGEMVSLGDPYGEAYYFMGCMPKDGNTAVIVSDDSDVFTHPYTELCRPEDFTTVQCRTQTAPFSGFASHFENGEVYFFKDEDDNLIRVATLFLLLKHFECHNLWLKVSEGLRGKHD